MLKNLPGVDTFVSAYPGIGVAGPDANQAPAREFRGVDSIHVMKCYKPITGKRLPILAPDIQGALWLDPEFSKGRAKIFGLERHLIGSAVGQPGLDGDR